MKRIQIFIVGVFMAVGSLYAQSDTDWKAGVAKVKELIKSNPAQAAEEAEQLVKGKNKKNIDLIVAIGEAYLNAGKIAEAQNYAALARKADNKSALAAVLEGDIAIEQKNPGVACQKYEEAIYFDSKCAEAYIKYADVYKHVNAELAIEKLEQYKAIDPANTDITRKLADIFYMKDNYAKVIETYAGLVASGEAIEDDLVKYAFALFLHHDFEKSLEIVNMGLKLNPRHAAFNRLAMYNYIDLQRYDEALKAADIFFNASEKADYSYLDYRYYGYLMAALKKYNEAVVQFEKAVEMDSTQTSLYKEISAAYEEGKDYKKAIEAYKKYLATLEADKITPDVQFQLGKLHYGLATLPDSLAATKEERIESLKAADAVFETVAKVVPDSYMGAFWRARANSALDPETTLGLAKPFYEDAAKLLESKNEARFNSLLVECYSYLGYYYYVANKMAESKEYWNKILAIDPTNANALKALEGIK